ncbi:cellulose synthase/poly-beta-1,6-N-acetylglucosamine synthase-like glycosyltransferase [Ilumatobacter fluminis]|uniref:Cellulose synthase/poly-beta-1,6-N-acetylglucosamine synthase-like glycosyltransferase n=1 Tax=Ilumatobacter fluminis TaxID=467091 RepID=A0A4R7HW76_9ACTN|nr:cellulose synthase/poly-beta-1,6-N-acetylglucosamine synthase-like glycosyltransferase [Ilumatobacter fluminis]
MTPGSLAPRQRSRRLVINRAPEPSDVQRRLESDRRRYSVGIVDPDQFASELAVEFARRERGGRNCGVASVSVFEIAGLQHRHGALFVFDLVSELVDVLRYHLAPTDVYHVAESGEVLVLGRDSTVSSTVERVQQLCLEIAGRRWGGSADLLLTPSAGIATLDDGPDAATIVRRAVDAREVASGHLDLRVHRWEPAMSVDTAPPERRPFERFGWQTVKERLRAPSQILATYVLGLFVPFCLYWFFDRVVGFDITWAVYLFCVLTLVSTGVMILVEARLAIRQKEPPEVESYPPASAIICAYLPNEAATIMDTLDAFLNQGYPGGLQVILAYNTPNPMAVERELHALADRHDDLEVVKIEGSTSKAQNVNAVLHMATGEFTGMFDADHMPRPGSFERSWRWLANGYDVVQGHCMTRNGDETWLAKMIAVEFESIYAVAHPGRAKLHRFGVFGGSNGYWRTDLLHETRMRGSMLTEDIDSSMRTVERGLKIRSDRDVVSRELATTTMKQVWNQRLRWAQGWFQVTMMHTARVWRSAGLNVRQKVGATYLLGWREVYPWLSLQVFPLVAYWYMSRGQMISAGWPILFFTTVFVLHVGPHQTWYAYKLADPEIKQHKSWFWGYLLFSTFFYTEYKNVIARVAHIKEFVGERAWKVTPRSDDPVEFDDDIDLGDDSDDEAGGSDDEVSPRRVRGPLAAAGIAVAALDESQEMGEPAETARPGIAARRATATVIRSESDDLDGSIAGLRDPHVHGDPLLGRIDYVVDATDAFGLPRRSRGVQPDTTRGDDPAPLLPRRARTGQSVIADGGNDCRVVADEPAPTFDPLLDDPVTDPDPTDAFGLPRRFADLRAAWNNDLDRHDLDRHDLDGI